MKKIFTQIKSDIKKIYKIIMMPEMRILPGNIAFSLMVSIVPIISIILMIGSSINLSSDVIINRLGDLIPVDILNTLLMYMEGNTINNVILIILGIWTASMGANAIILASNQIYKFKDSDYIQRRIKAFLITLLLILVVIINLVILVFGNSIVTLILKLTNMGDLLLYLFSFFKWPVSLVLIFVVIKLLYTVAPDERIKSNTVNKGAIFTTLIWLVSSVIFSFYTTNIADFTKYYGGLASIIILMIWLYILSYILVLGIAINSSAYKKVEISNNNN